jgi:hypothetical protein
MTARAQVHDFVRDLYRDCALRSAFTADPARVIGERDFTTEERAALLDASFEALGRIGMHPLLQMVYSLARFPEIKAQISVRDYLDDLQTGG